MQLAKSRSIKLPKAILFIACFFAIQLAYTYTEPRSILVLGDSHMKGYFGEFFHKKLHSSGRFFILNVAIGGAGTKTFTHDQLRSTCCGYRVRYTCPESKLKEKEWIPVLESSEDS